MRDLNELLDGVKELKKDLDSMAGTAPENEGENELYNVWGVGVVGLELIKMITAITIVRGEIRGTKTDLALEKVSKSLDEAFYVYREETKQGKIDE